MNPTDDRLARYLTVCTTSATGDPSVSAFTVQFKSHHELVQDLHQQAIEPAHLLMAQLSGEEGVVPAIVGKTAIVEGFAQRIVNGDVPEGLKNKRLDQLELSALVAGAKFRGEFEECLKAVLKEIAESDFSPC